MHDRNISLRTALACLLWAAGACLSILDLFGWLNAGSIGIVAAIAGATLNIQGFVAHLAYRERNAFEIGCDYARKEPLVSVDRAR